jgi:hypothetical protein
VFFIVIAIILAVVYTWLSIFIQIYKNPSPSDSNSIVEMAEYFPVKATRLAPLICDFHCPTVNEV